MSRLMDGAFARHSIIDPDGFSETSADPDDYWDKPDSFVFEGGVLVRMNHPYVTVTDLVVLSPRPLKSDPSIGDLRRLHKARATLRSRMLQHSALDSSDTMMEGEGE